MLRDSGWAKRLAPMRDRTTDLLLTKQALYHWAIGAFLDPQGIPAHKSPSTCFYATFSARNTFQTTFYEFPMLSSPYPPSNTLHNTLLFYLRTDSILSHCLIFKSLFAHFPCFIHHNYIHTLQHYSSFFIYALTSFITWPWQFFTFFHFYSASSAAYRNLCDEVSPTYLIFYQRAARVLQIQVLVESVWALP